MTISLPDPPAACHVAPRARRSWPSARLAVATSLFFGLALGSALPAFAAKPHQHGAVAMEVSVDGRALSIGVELPLDSLVGFERAPRNDGERRAAADALARLRDGAALFRPEPAAQCSLGESEVHAPVLEQGAAPTGGHAEAEARYGFHCVQPERLTTVEVLLFDVFRRIDRVDVQAALPKGQRKAVLRPTARVLRLDR